MGGERLDVAIIGVESNGDLYTAWPIPSLEPPTRRDCHTRNALKRPIRGGVSGKPRHSDMRRRCEKRLDHLQVGQYLAQLAKFGFHRDASLVCRLYDAAGNLDVLLEFLVAGIDHD